MKFNSALRRTWTALMGIACLLLLASGGATAATRINFDHFTTGFPLTGAHKGVDCESCHNRGVFKGTPTKCSGCHMTGTLAGATAKPQ
ncbi:MAG: hypothetical protein P8164_01330, partial [Gammaproteobacteria bacterium]